LGWNNHGELDGEQNHVKEIQRMPRPITIPTKDKIVRIKAKNSRSCVFTQNGEVWHWGGNSAGGLFLPRKGYELINESEEIKKLINKGHKILDLEMGYGHYVLLTEFNKM